MTWLRRILFVLLVLALAVLLAWRPWSHPGLAETTTVLPAPTGVTPPAGRDDVLAIVFSGDGGWRDLDEVAKVGLPIIGTGEAPFSGPKEEMGEINVAVSCGGVVVHPGDLIVGDHTGTVAIPRAQVQAVIEEIAQHRVAEAKYISEVTNTREDTSRVAHAYWETFDRSGGWRAD